MYCVLLYPFFFFLIENTFNKKLKRNFSVVLARDIMSREYFSHSRCDASAFFMQQKTFFVEFKKKTSLIIILSTNKFLNKWNISSHLHVSYMMTIIARWLRSIIRAKWCDAYELLVEVPTIEWELIERTWEWLIVYNLNVMTSNACLRNLHYTRCYLDPSTWSRGY